MGKNKPAPATGDKSACGRGAPNYRKSVAPAKVFREGMAQWAALMTNPRFCHQQM
jgi:hypothetical protein